MTSCPEDRDDDEEDETMAANTTRTSQVLEALELAWAAIQANHPDVPDAVLIVASGAKARGMKWGHFARSSWQVGSADEIGCQGHESLDGAHMGETVQCDGSCRPSDQTTHEVLVGAEGLSRGPFGVLGTLLHEAAHGMAAVREIEDTSRGGRYHNKRFAKLADEVGIKVDLSGSFGYAVTSVPTETLKAYADVLDVLAEALTFWRRAEGRGSKPKSRNNPKAECGCGRILRIAPATLAAGPIVCGLCEQEFEVQE